MYCNKSICQNSDNQEKQLCCYYCNLKKKCETSCDERKKDCDSFILKKENLYSSNEEFRRSIKDKLECRTITGINYNSTDNNEIIIECAGAGSLTITPTIIDGKARLSLEIKYTKTEIGLL